jgi:hypothetical protein
MDSVARSGVSSRRRAAQRASPTRSSIDPNWMSGDRKQPVDADVGEERAAPSNSVANAGNRLNVRMGLQAGALCRVDERGFCVAAEYPSSDQRLKA